MKKYFYTLILSLLSFAAKSQLYVESGATLFLETGSVVTVQGDLTSNVDIQGPGKILMKGTAAQNLNMNGKVIPNLEIDNTNNVLLTGACKVSNSLAFTNGKIQLGNNNFTLASAATYTGAAAGKFAQTNGTGSFLKEVTAVGNYILPVGAGASYTPLQYQLSGTPTFSTASLGARAVDSAHPNRPVRADDYLKFYWKPIINGITGGTLNAAGTYADAGSITGAETFLNAIRWDGTNWSLDNSTINAATNTATFNTVKSNTDLYAMDKFVLVKAKAFLQGAYDTTLHIMKDILRGNGTSNVIPLSDPYRTSPYSTIFTHDPNNTVTEIVSSSVFNTKTPEGDNIVDWVFLELRNTNASPGNGIIATRSALLQKDGDIVDVDGKSPVFFKNITAGNFILAIRHRNHLGIAANQANYFKTLSVANPSAANTFDFSIANANQIYKTASSQNEPYALMDNKKMLWAGNANAASGSNKVVRYSGPGNDAAYILSTILGGNVNGFVSGYSIGDLNLNKFVRYSGPSNDAAFILSPILSSDINGSRTQSLPN